MKGYNPARLDINAPNFLVPDDQIYILVPKHPGNLDVCASMLKLSRVIDV